MGTIDRRTSVHEEREAMGHIKRSAFEHARQGEEPDAYTIRVASGGRLARKLRDRATIRDLLVLKEVLDRPVALR
jgi:hypothetical protein